MNWTAFPLLLLAVVACILRRTQSAFNTHPLLQECAEGSGALFNATWEQGALTRGTVRWTPASNRFLLAHCVRGQITNRLLCLRNHMLLAGLLNRTLLIPFHRSETILDYDLHLVLDLAYLRSCIGPTVFTTAEFRRKFRRPVQVSQVVCWHGPPGACADQVDNILLHCPGLDEMRRDDGSGSGGNDDAAAADGAAVGDGDAAGDDGDNGAAGGMASDGGSGMAAGTPGVVFDTRVPVSHSLFRSPLVHLPPNTTTHAACLPMLASPQQVLRAWGSNPSPVLVVGDLLNLHVSHAHEGTLRGGATHEPPAQVEENMDGETPQQSPADGETPQQSPADGTTTTITAQQQPFLDLPFRRSAACPSPLLLRPRPALLESAELLVGRLFGGRPFLALHWRRGDFKPWCFWRGPKHACFYPVHQVAHWVVERVRESGIQELFLATNAKLKELQELTRNIARITPTSITFHRLPPLTGTLDKPPVIVTYTNATNGATVTITSSMCSSTNTSNNPEFEGQNQFDDWVTPLASIVSDSRNIGIAASVLEKLVCVQATVFFGSVASTFSQDIQRFRHGLRTAHCNDTNICAGEMEWVKNKGRR